MLDSKEIKAKKKKKKGKSHPYNSSKIPLLID